MSALVSFERDHFDADLLAQASEEALRVRYALPALMAINHGHSYWETDSTSGCGYTTIRPSLYYGSEQSFQLETPALHSIVHTLQQLPYTKGATIPDPTPVIVIHYSMPRGEVSRHSDKGRPDRNWLGRCATLQGYGRIQFYEHEHSNKIIDAADVTAGDITTHFNHADPNLRLPHNVPNLGDDMRISLGVLVALKNGIRGRLRAEQQAAHAV